MDRDNKIEPIVIKVIFFMIRSYYCLYTVSLAQKKNDRRPMDF